VRRLVLGLAVAALVAPAAQARLDSGTTAQANAADSTAVIQGDDKVIIAPKDFDGLLHGDDKVIIPEPVATPVVAVRSPGSFDWGDALIGAGVAFGAMLLLGGATLATRHVRPAGA
jgi:hypothetical protein